MEENEELLPSAVHIQGYNEKAFIYPSSSGFNSLDYSLCLIPSYEKGGKCPIMVRAWCSDLILCSSLQTKEPVLHICDPRTKQWFQLPAPTHRVHHCLVDFICDPYYVYDKGTGTVTLNTCRYSVCYDVPVLRRVATGNRNFLIRNWHWEENSLIVAKVGAFGWQMLLGCFVAEHLDVDIPQG